jgi:hypothetical protein
MRACTRKIVSISWVLTCVVGAVLCSGPRNCSTFAVFELLDVLIAKRTHEVQGVGGRREKEERRQNLIKLQSIESTGRCLQRLAGHEQYY